MNGNRKLRELLILQSFMPLMFLLLLKNFEFNLFNLVYKFFIRIWICDFSIITVVIAHGKFLILIVVVWCLLWILKGILAMFQFRNVQNSNFIEGDKIVIKNYTSDASLIFYTTFIMPLVLENIGNPRNFLVFIGLLTMIIALMCKTNLYYQNPVLTILGYKTFQFHFVEDKNNEFIGITYGKIDESKIIKYQLVADNVYLIYNKTQYLIH